MSDKLRAVVNLDVLGVVAGVVFNVDDAVEAGLDVASLIACGAAAGIGQTPVGTVSEPKDDSVPSGKRAKKSDAGRIDGGTVTLNDLTEYAINKPDPEAPDGD